MQENVDFGASNTQYSAYSQTARDILTNNFNWVIDDDGEDENFASHKLKARKIAIENTWNNFVSAVVSGDPETSLQYMTPGFSESFSALIDELGDEVAEVVNQVDAIAPYYSDTKHAIYLIKKTNDANKVSIHTMTFIASDDGSWKIKEM